MFFQGVAICHFEEKRGWKKHIGCLFFRYIFVTLRGGDDI